MLRVERDHGNSGPSEGAETVLSTYHMSYWALVDSSRQAADWLQELCLSLACGKKILKGNADA